MYYARSGLKPVVASLTVLVLLLSGGVFAYDTRIQSGTTSGTPGLDSDTSNQTPQYLKFDLVPLPVASTYKSGQGYAKVMIQGHTVTVWLSLSGGMPSAKLAAVMPVISERGNHSISLGTLTSSDGGNAQLQTQTQFDSGNYQIGLELFDVSSFTSEVMVVVSNPEYAQVLIADPSSTSTTTTQSKTTTSSTETKPTTANLPNILQFHLIPLPTAQGTDLPNDYPFKEGVAVIYLTPTQIGLKVSFVGAPNSAYSIVLQENGANVTVGSIVTDQGGSGVFYSLIPLRPGTYQFGFLIYLGDVEQNLLVALGDPRSVTATLPTIANTTTKTTTTYTGTSTSTSTTKTESGSTTENTNAGENVIPLKLLPLPAYLLTAQPDNYPFRGGGAVIHIRGNSLLLVVSFLGTPDTQFTVVLQKDDDNYTLGSVTTNHDGGGVLKKEFSLDPGVYKFGILIYLSTTAAEQGDLVGLSTPRGVTLNISYTTTTTTTTERTKSENHNQNEVGLKFVIVPVPIWTGSSLPDNYPFKLGGAFIGLDGTSLRVMISFMGTANTPFTFVLMANDVNMSLGSVTTSSGGVGALRSELSLNPGEYRLGVLVFSPTSDLVGLSIPRAEMANISNEGSTAGTTFQPMTFSFKLNPAPATTAQTGSYRFGRGEVSGIFADGVLAMYGSIFNASPNTKYAFLLSVNGTSHEIARLVTDQNGNARVMMGLRIGNGTFVVGMRVNDTSSFATPRTVLVSDPPVRLISTHFFEGRVTTTTESKAEHKGAPELKFKIVGAHAQNLSPTYSIGKGEANIAVHGQTLILRMEIEHANPNTEYGISLSINGTSTRVGSLVTNHQGNGQLRAEWNLDPGTYLIGVLVYDTSTFTPPALVMSSDPESLAAVIVPSSSTASSTTSTESEASHSVSTITGDKDDEDKIKVAVSSLTIPAVVHVGGSNASFSVIDPRFSIAVGRQGGHGIIISISATNVTGPRILLLNLTQNSFLKLEGSALNVTLDGNPVVEASTVTQVLNPSPNDPARYVVVATSSGIQMLISIPHFSLHLIQVIPIPVAQIQNFLIVNAEALVASLLVITVVFAAVYKTRQKIFSIFL